MTFHFDFKIVVAGPFAAGKTTMINAISDDDVVGTEAPTSGAEADVKETTTVGMEYGTLRAAGDGFSAELSIYGVPGQERFQFMWDIVGTGMDGLFLLVDGSRPETWADSFTVGQYFRQTRLTPIVVGVNRAAGNQPLVDEVCAAVPLDGAQYLGFDVVDRVGVRDALVELLALVLDSLPDDALEAHLVPEPAIGASE